MRKRHTRRRFVATALGAAGLSSGLAFAATARRDDTELGREEAIQAVFDAGEKVREALGIDGVDGLTVGAEPNADGDMAIVLNGFHTIEAAKEWADDASGGSNGRGRGQSARNRSERGRGNGRREESGPPDYSRGLARGRRRAILRSRFPVGQLPDEVEVEVGSQSGRRRTTTFPVEVRHRVHRQEGHPGQSPHEVETFDHNVSGDLYDTNLHSPLVSGAKLQTTHGTCSLGAPAEGPGGTRYATVAGHCVETGDPVHQPYSRYGRKIGEVTSKIYNRVGRFDGALIELEHDVEYDGDITLGSGPYAEFQGSMGMWDLIGELMQQNPGWYMKYGAKTGPTGGRLGGIVSLEEYTFWVDANAAPGDSGAACWNYSDNNAAGTASGDHVMDAECFLICPDDIPEMHQTVYTCYEGFEERFGVTMVP